MEAMNNKNVSIYLCEQIFSTFKVHTHLYLFKYLHTQYYKFNAIIYVCMFLCMYVLCMYVCMYVIQKILCLLATLVFKY